MFLVLEENSLSGGYSRNLPFSKWIEKPGWTLNQRKCSCSSPSLFSESICYRRENVDSGSLSCKNFPWETLVIDHKPLSQWKVCFSCNWWLVLFSSPVLANESSVWYRGDKCLLAERLWLGECAHCPSTKVQEHGEPQVINLVFGLKVINSACSSDYWLVIFLSLVLAQPWYPESWN